VVSCNLGSFAKGLRYALGIRGRIFLPFLHAKLGGVDADDTALSHAVIVKNTCDTTANFDRFEKLRT